MSLSLFCVQRSKDLVIFSRTVVVVLAFLCLFFIYICHFVFVDDLLSYLLLPSEVMYKKLIAPLSNWNSVSLELNGVRMLPLLLESRQTWLVS